MQFRKTLFASMPMLALLAAPAMADKAMLVFDASGSMNAQIAGKTKLQIAREVVDGLVQEWPQATELGLIAYGHREKDNCGDIQTLVKPAADSWPAIKAAVGDVEAKGKTPITEAVRAAAKELKSEEGKATVILVSDGLETCNADPCAAAAELEKSGVDFTVHVVGFGTTAEENRQLQCIADKTGGRFLGAKNAAELKTAMTKTVELVAKPEPPKQNVVKVISRVASLKIINSKSPYNLYDASDKKVSISYAIGGNYGDYLPKDKAVELPPGSYKLKNASDLEIVRSFELSAGKVTIIDLTEHVGSLRIVNHKTPQRLYDSDGHMIPFSYAIGGSYADYFPKNQPAELPPGSYQIKNETDLVIADKVEIKVGKETVIDIAAHAGSFRMINNSTPQRLYDSQDKLVPMPYNLGGSYGDHLPKDKALDLPPGNYRVKNVDGLVTVDGFEVKTGEETVLDFGNL